MNRRTLLSSIFGASAVLALDPEKALWTPGKKLISIPKRQLPFTAYGIKCNGQEEGKICLDWEAPIGTDIEIESLDPFYGDLNSVVIEKGTGTRKRSEILIPDNKIPIHKLRIRVKTKDPLEFKLTSESFSLFQSKARIQKEGFMHGRMDHLDLMEFTQIGTAAQFGDEFSLPASRHAFYDNPFTESANPYHFDIYNHEGNLSEFRWPIAIKAQD